MTVSDRFASALKRFLDARHRLDHDLPADPSPEEEDIAAGAYSYARDALIRTPALTVSDLRAKVEVLWQDRASDKDGEAALAIMRDLHEMTNREPSRCFDADTWLTWFERRGGVWIERDAEILFMVPSDGSMDDVMYNLDACGGLQLVFDLIRERSRAKAA